MNAEDDLVSLSCCSPPAQASESGTYKDIVLICCMSHEDMVRNMRANLRRHLPRFRALARTYEGASPVALCAGGPSIEDHLEELRDFHGPIVSCGSTHDYLIRNGIFPDYAVLSDPLPVCVNFLKEHSSFTTYLVSSVVDAGVLDRLQNDKVFIWHSIPVAVPGDIPEDEWDGDQTIPGGTSAILRAWPLMAVVGYLDFHFFGFDCSFPKEKYIEQYAYQRADTENIPEAINIQIKETGHEFWTNIDLAYQSTEFQAMVNAANGKCKITMHGNGMAADCYNYLSLQSKAA